MRLRMLLLCLVTLVVSSTAMAKDEYFRPATPAELALKDVPFAPGAPAVILDWVRRRNDQMFFEQEYVRIKILKDDGKKYADIELPYVPGYTRIKGIKARTIAPDGTIRNFDGKIYDKLVVKVYGTRVMNKTFTLPDAAPGSIIEYTYTRELPTDTLYSTDWSVQRELPVMHQTLSFRPYSGEFASFSAYMGLPEGKRPAKGESGEWELELSDMQALPDEPNSPPSVFYASKVLYYYQRAGQDAPKFWEQYVKDSTRYVETWAKETGLIKSTAQTLTAGITDEEAKLRKLYAHVQGLRNLSYEEEKSEQESRREKLRDNNSVTDVQKNGYGYRTHLNRLFLALARSSGFDAQPLDVAQRDELFTKTLPDSSELEEIVTVNLGGKQRFFDPGTAFLPFGMLAWDNAAVSAVRYAKKMEAEWLTTPDITPAEALLERFADLKLDGDTLTGTVRTVATGHRAIFRRWDVQHSDEAETKKSFEDEAKAWFPEGSSVKLTKLTGVKATDEPLVAEYDVTLTGIGAAAGSRVVLPLAVFSSTWKNPFSSPKRLNDIFFKHAYETVDRVTVALPDEYVVDTLPAAASLPYGSFKYSNEWKSGEKSVTYTRRISMAASLFGAEKYNTIRNFYSKVATADQDAVVLKAAPSKGGK